MLGGYFIGDTSLSSLHLDELGGYWFTTLVRNYRIHVPYTTTNDFYELNILMMFALDICLQVQCNTQNQEGQGKETLS